MATATAPDLSRAAELFQALSDEKRLRILSLLAGGERCVCDLQAAVGSYQSRLSFHLKKLKEAGLLTSERRGTWVYYRVEPSVLAAMGQLLAVR